MKTPKTIASSFAEPTRASLRITTNLITLAELAANGATGLTSANQEVTLMQIGKDARTILEWAEANVRQNSRDVLAPLPAPKNRP